MQPFEWFGRLRKHMDLGAKSTNRFKRKRHVVAVAARREQVNEFRRLLYDDEYFKSEAEWLTRPEDVWQKFFEANPWIFGVTLAGQFLTSWSPERLEQARENYRRNAANQRVFN